MILVLLCRMASGCSTLCSFVHDISHVIKTVADWHGLLSDWWSVAGWIAPTLQLCSLQGFWQRVWNYWNSWITKLLHMETTISSIHKFRKQTGQAIRTDAAGATPSAAVIAGVDWALECPRPLSPKVHVCMD